MRERQVGVQECCNVGDSLRLLTTSFSKSKILLSHTHLPGLFCPYLQRPWSKWPSV